MKGSSADGEAGHSRQDGRTRPASDKRTRILKAARELLSERRFEEATVPEIVKRAGVAQGTFYRYFPAKSDVVNALTDALRADIDAAFVGVIAGRASDPLSEVLEALIRGQVAATEPYKDVLGFLNTEGLLFGRTAEAERAREPYLKAIEELVRRAQRAGEAETRMDPHLAARLTGSVLDRMARDCLLYRTDIPPEDYLAETVGFLRRALGITPRGRPGRRATPAT